MCITELYKTVFISILLVSFPVINKLPSPLLQLIWNKLFENIWMIIILKILMKLSSGQVACPYF